MRPRPQSMDTHLEAEQAQISLLRQASVARRFSVACSLSQSTIQLARRAIRRKRPEADEQEVLLTFVEVHYGEQLAERLRAYLAGR